MDGKIRYNTFLHIFVMNWPNVKSLGSTGGQSPFEFSVTG